VRTSRLLLRRARAHAGLLGLVLLLGVVVSATVGGTLAATLGAARDAARDSLADAGPVGGSLQVSTRLDDDTAGQTAAAQEALDAALAGTPGDATRTLRSLSLAVRTDPTAAPDDDGPHLVLGTDPGLTSAARLVDGDWPDGATAAGTVDAPDPAVLHAAAADALGVTVGDLLVVSGDGETERVLAVVGTWLPDDPADPRWAGEPLVTDGVDAATGAFGPAMVDETVLADVPGIDLVRWTVVADPGRVEPADLAPLAAGLDRFVVLAEQSVQAGGLSTSGDLPGTLRAADAALTAVAAVTSAALALVAVVAVVALAQVARLLGAVRSTETTVLRSRGTSVGQLTAAAALETAAVVAPAAAVGAVLAGVVVGTADVPVLVLGAAAVAVVGTATLTLGARAAAVRAGDRSDPAGRRAPIVTGGVLVLVVLAAALATWRLVRSAGAGGGPGGGAPGAGGTASAVAEPAAVAAVPLTVLAVALLAAAALGPVTSAVARRSRGRTGLVVPLAARQVARRTTVYAVPVVLVTLATATGALASVHAGTTASQQRTAATAALGADLRVDVRDALDVQVDGTSPTDALLPLAGGRTVPVLRVTAGSTSRVGTLLAVPAESAGAVVRDDGAPGLGTALDAVTAGDGWVVPDGATSVRVDATLDGGVTSAHVWWAGPDGVLRATSATRVAGEDAWTADLPEVGTGAGTADSAGRVARWAVAGVDLVPDGPPAQASLVTVTGVTADGPDGTTDLLAGGAWRAAAPGSVPVQVAAGSDAGTGTGADPGTGSGTDEGEGDAGSAPGAPGTPGTVTVPSTGVPRTVLRILPGPATALPVVVSADWAAEDGLAVGAPVVLRVDGHPVDAEVVGVLPVVPGAPGRAALADLRGVGAALLATAPSLPAPDEVWVATDDPDGTATAARAAAAAQGLSVDTATVAAPDDDPLTRAASTALVVAAVCALGVALPGVAAATLALARARRPEVGVLHALGVPPRTQARGRAAETGAVLALAVVVGTAGGLVLGAVLAPALVRVVGVAPATLATVAAVQPVVLGVLLGAVVMGCTLVALDDAARVRRQAATATVREDAR